MGATLNNKSITSETHLSRWEPKYIYRYKLFILDSVVVKTHYLARMYHVSGHLFYIAQI